MPFSMEKIGFQTSSNMGKWGIGINRGVGSRPCSGITEAPPLNLEADMKADCQIDLVLCGLVGSGKVRLYA
jgi:hypothetical protein